MLLTDTHFKDNSGGCCSRNERHAWRNGRPCGCLTADTDRRPDPRPLGLTDNCRGWSGETVVLGAPVYAGRVAPEAVRRLRRIQVAAGASVPAVLTVTYGNRDYEDALVELYDLAVSIGLSPFACP